MDVTGKKLSEIIRSSKKLLNNFLDHLSIRDFFLKFYYQYRNFAPSKLKDTLRSIRFHSNFIRKGDLCFDIGANIGDYTLIYLILGARVVCIEPEKENLRKLIIRYQKKKNVSIVPKALADFEGFSELFTCKNLTTISTISKKWKSNGRFSDKYKNYIVQKVPTTTLDMLIKQYGLPKFCKIDVEGSEYKVLKGLTKKIQYISFEITKEFIGDAINCVDYLINLGNVRFNFFHPKIKDFYYPRWVKKDKLFEGLNKFNDELFWGDIYAKFL